MSNAMIFGMQYLGFFVSSVCLSMVYYGTRRIVNEGRSIKREKGNWENKYVL